MHMLPLKNVPRMLKHKSNGSGGSSSSSNPKGRLALMAANGNSAATAIASPLRNGTDAETASQTTTDAASEVSTAVSVLETEEKDLRERLVVLEEQRFLVHEMLASAHAGRRFEEVSALSRNVEELDREIADVKASVRQVEDRWRGVYANGGPG